MLIDQRCCFFTEGRSLGCFKTKTTPAVITAVMATIAMMAVE